MNTTFYNDNNSGYANGYPYSPASTASASPLQKPQQQSLYDPRFSLMIKGYEATDKITKTLQGSIWKGCLKKGQFTRDIVIKCTSRALHASKSTVLDGEKVDIEENVVKEMEILRNLTQNGLTKYIVSYIDFFYDDFNYFLIMENGGSSLFDFIVKAHGFILNGSLEIIEWQNVCKILFFQMVSCLDILHNKMNICHLDLSLENMLINDVLFTIDPYNPNKIHFVNDFSVKLCDFGLAEQFDLKTNPNFISSKFCGKTAYKAPEIYAKKANFDARKADIWSLGVCLWCLVIGCMPFNIPSDNDPIYQWVSSGNVTQIIQKWQKSNYVNKHIIQCLNSIFKKEPNKRISIKELLKHPIFYS